MALAQLEVETEATEGSGQRIANSRQLLKILRRLGFANGNSRPGFAPEKGETIFESVKDVRYSKLSG
jgi:hypothetical protein